MSDRLAVFNEGRIEQVGTPAEVYERPATEFVAGFVGISNILERDGRRFSVRPEQHRVERGTASRRTVADVVFVGVVTRYLRGHRGRASADGRAAERRAASIAERTRVHVHWRDEDAYEIEHPGNSTQQEDQMKKGTLGVLSSCFAAMLCLPGGRRLEGERRHAEHDRLGGLPQPQWVKPFEKADRLPGPREVRRLLGRDGHAHALGRRQPVRHGLGLRRREPPADLRQATCSRRPSNGPRLQELRQGVPVAAEQHRERHALRHLAAVGPEHAALQHEAREAGADVAGR